MRVRTCRSGLLMSVAYVGHSLQHNQIDVNTIDINITSTSTSASSNHQLSNWHLDISSVQQRWCPCMNLLCAPVNQQIWIELT